MPDTPPTPTVLDRDRALAAKFWRFLHGGYTWAPDEEEEAKMAAEIAAAREAGGVSREAVAGLVEAGKAFFAEDSWCAFAEMHDATATKCPCGYVRLRAALERAKEAQG